MDNYILNGKKITTINEYNGRVYFINSSNVQTSMLFEDFYSEAKKLGPTKINIVKELIIEPEPKRLGPSKMKIIKDPKINPVDSPTIDKKIKKPKILKEESNLKSKDNNSILEKKEDPFEDYL